MIERLFPDKRIASVYTADYDRLYEEGIRTVLYDIDNTLVLHDAPANERARQLFARLKKKGFFTCLVSNNEEKRVVPFAKEVGADCYICNAHKPSASGYLKAVECSGCQPQQAVFFGDQLFTDVWGAKSAGIRSYLVDPVGPEKLLKIKLKRILEKPILTMYEKQVK